MKESVSTKYFRELSKGKEHLQKQYIYDSREDVTLAYEDSDPLGENKYKVAPRLIHRYKDRVLLLVTDRCALYCRHCFRRDYVDTGLETISDSDLKEVCNYIRSHKEVHEILLSGGDPLILGDGIDRVLKAIKEAREDIVIRIGSRLPIVDPERVDDNLAKILGEYRPLWLSIQCNHSDELTEMVKVAIDRLLDRGINIVNQSVLLKGVNDSVEELKSLCHKLLEFRIKPYYLFQGDLARGTSHLRVPVQKGLKLIKELRKEISGLAMPTYAVDIPGGGGKIPLNRDYIVGEDENWIYLESGSGKKGRYPKE